MEAKRPEPGQVETRHVEVAADGRKIRGIVPYGVESRDLGGFTEVIEAGALRATNLNELVARVDHAGVPIGRYPTTLELEDRSDGLAWAVTPPQSRADLIEAVERGDLRAGSWQMVVGKDRWDGDTRHVESISELRDVSVVSSPAYPASAVEYRAAPTTNQEDDMSEDSTPSVPAEEARAEDNENKETEKTEERERDPGRPAGSLRVEDRREGGGPMGLAAAFEARGWPQERAELTWTEYQAECRALTVSAAADDVNQSTQQSGPYGFDQRYAWPAFPAVAVGRDVTSITVMQQTARSLATAANVVRAIDAVSAKPETASTVDDVVTSLKQVASVQTAVPNVYLEQAAFRTVIEQDLRHAIDGGLDKLVLDAIATAGFQAPSTDNILVSIRKAITTVQSNGYEPNTLLLTPGAAETIDTMVSGVTGGSADFVFAPGAFAPGVLFGLQRRVSKTIPAPAVVDAAALGKMFMSPVALERFEADAGTTNKSNVRLELHACFGLERVGAAVRIAAS